MIDFYEKPVETFKVLHVLKNIPKILQNKTKKVPQNYSTLLYSG